MANARIRQARPRTAMTSVLRRELRRALGHQGVLLAGPFRPALADADADLAPVAERIGHGAGVDDRDRRRAVQIPDPEADRGAAHVADRAVDDLPVDLVGPARLALREQVARLELLDGCADGREDQRAREQDGGGQRHDEAHLALASGIHAPPSIASGPTRPGANTTELKCSARNPMMFRETFWTPERP